MAPHPPPFGGAECTNYAVNHVFPLPLTRCPAARGGLSRSVTQRVVKQQRIQERVNEVVHALIFLSGGHESHASVGSECQLHTDAHQHIRSLVCERDPVDAPTEKEAVSVLLRAKSGYDDADVTVATYQEGKVSLPDDVSDAPYADEICSDHLQVLLEGFEESLLRDPDDLARVKASCGEPVL